MAAKRVFGLVLPTPDNLAQQKLLQAELVRCIEAAKDAQASFASEKSYEMQCEQLSLQKKMDEKLNMLLSCQKTENSHIPVEQTVLPMIAGQQSCEEAEG